MQTQPFPIPVSLCGCGRCAESSAPATDPARWASTSRSPVETRWQITPLIKPCQRLPAPVQHVPRGDGGTIGRLKALAKLPETPQGPVSTHSLGASRWASVRTGCITGAWRAVSSGSFSQGTWPFLGILCSSPAAATTAARSLAFRERKGFSVLSPTLTGMHPR